MGKETFLLFDSSSHWGTVGCDGRAGLVLELLSGGAVHGVQVGDTGVGDTILIVCGLSGLRLL